MRHLFLLTTLLALQGGCALREAPDAAYFDMAAGRLPPADTTLAIAGLGPCTDNPDRTLRLDASRPVHVLVHGCFGSSGQFRGLAQVLAFHGQQSACFTYDDRAGLARSAADLREAVGQLAGQTGSPQITLIGHSQGALIARSALTQALPAVPTAPGGSELRLVTVSGPFSGIAAAQTCGKTWLYPLTLGLLPAACHLATGAKWADITFSSRFILEPGTLAPGVSSHLKIDTDERGSCRREQNGRCLEDDDVFSLAEQRSQPVEADSRARRVEARAGHVEIVGDRRVAPVKLINILQEQGVLSATAPERRQAFNQLLARVYQDDSFVAPGTPGRR